MSRLLIIFIALCAVARAEDPAGSWKGAIDLPTAKLRISIELQKKDAWTGTISIPSQGLRDKALSDVVVDDGKVQFKIPDIPGDPKFDGVLDGDGRSIAGTYSQGGGKLKFALERSEKPGEPLLQERLERLVKQFEERRIEYHIPGMALAVVKDGKVVLTRGFGLADVGTKKPVTPETIFAIGSTTKAFTATATGMLIDEGKMTWDDPVTGHLPDFKLPVDSEDAGAEATVRDLLAHRTGFARMGVLWAAGRVSREEILATAVNAKPWAKHREKFQYCNVTYLAAGQAAAAAAGTDWDTLIRERIFKPLGMANSSTTFAEAQADPRLSSGYLPREEPTAVPMRNLDSIGPAGSINSNVVDMAKWVKFLLAGGVVGDQRLISKEQLEETHRPQIDTGAGAKYGFGWMLRPIDGRNVIEHGGNIDGFGAQVGLFPDDNLGFVLLTNVSASPLQSLSNNLVGEVILGEWREEAVPTDAKELQAYVGEYVGNFAAFKNADFTVLVKNGKLAVDVPGQIAYELKPPNDEGKWVFAITDTIAVSFDRDKKDAVVLMKMHQGGATFELPRRGAERKAEITAEEAGKFLGKFAYSDELAFEIRFNEGRLAIDIPGRIQSDLHPPDKDGKRRLRMLPDRSVKFHLSEKGNVESITIFQDGRDPKEMPRLGKNNEEAAPNLPTVEEVLALRGVKARGAVLEKLKSLRFSGTIKFVNAGVDGKHIVETLGTDRFRVTMDMGRFGFETRIVNRDGGKIESDLKPTDRLDGKPLEQARQHSPAVIFGDWSKHFNDISLLPSENVNGRPAHVLQLVSGDLPAITTWVDAENGNLLKSEMRILVPTMGMEIPTTTFYDDHREVAGIRLPWKSTVQTEMTGRIMTQLENVETDVNLDETRFQIE